MFAARSLLHRLGRALVVPTDGVVPPDTDAQTRRLHGALDPVGRREGLVLGLRRPEGRLVVPFLVDDLEADHLVDVVEEARLLVAVPDPQAVGVAVLGALGELVEGDEDVFEEIGPYWRGGKKRSVLGSKGSSATEIEKRRSYC